MIVRSWIIFSCVFVIGFIGIQYYIRRSQGRDSRLIGPGIGSYLLVWVLWMIWGPTYTDKYVYSGTGEAFEETVSKLLLPFGTLALFFALLAGVRRCHGGKDSRIAISSIGVICVGVWTLMMVIRFDPFFHGRPFSTWWELSLQSPAMDEPILADALLDATRERSPEVICLEAIRRLGFVTSSNEGVVERLREILVSRSGACGNTQYSRIEAAEALARHRGGSLVLLHAAVGDLDEDARVDVLHALIDAVDVPESGVGLLTDMLASPDARVREASLRILARLGSSAEPAIDRTRNLLHDSEVMVRCSAAWALWRIGGDVEQAVRVLERELALHGSADDMDKTEVVGWLRQLGQ